MNEMKIFIFIKVTKNIALKISKKTRESVFDLFHHQYNYGF
jgi:hypothetical protein